MSGENVFSTISNEYYNLTAAEKKTADYVMAHQTKVQELSISELAERSDVAEATVSRFCRRLGFKGYNAFKLAVANSVASLRGELSPLSGEVTEEDSFSELCQKVYASDVCALSQTMELINEEAISTAARLIRNATRVCCMGQGGSMIIAEEAAHLFSTVSGKFYAVGDSHFQSMTASNMNPGELILYFSYSGATRDMMDTLKVARDRGAKIVLVTHYPNSPGAQMADVVLQCGADESPLQLGSVGARISQLFLLDVIFSEICRFELDACRERRSRVASVLADKHI